MCCFVNRVFFFLLLVFLPLQGMIQSNNKHANTCVVSNDDAVSTCKAMAFFMDRQVLAER